MKKIIYIILSAIVLSSCNEWLEATSSTQFKAEEIFSTREGVLDALSGVYITMGHSSLYGASVTWKYNDLLVYPMPQFSGTMMHDFQSRDFSSDLVKREIDNIWAAFYNSIANVNMILDNVDVWVNSFSSQSECNWVKGELLALRAYLHFDLLRLFGDVFPEADKLTVPYVLHYSKVATEQLSYQATFDLLTEDLKNAMNLLADDPVTGVYPENYNMVINADGYWNNRRRHLNFYATCALAARVYMWTGQYAEAASLARIVIDQAFEKKAVDWVNLEKLLESSTNNYNRDWTYSTEHLFNLDITGLNTDAMDYTIPSGAVSGRGDYFYLSTFPYDNVLFPTMYADDLSGLEDIRGTASNIHFAGSYYVSYKLYGSSTSVFRNVMPMIRISEMYYILAEERMSAKDYDTAYAYLDEVRKHRGVTLKLKYVAAVEGPDKELRARYQELYYEYMREFINEGQTLHFVKRYTKTIPYALVFNNIGGDGELSLSIGASYNFKYPYPDTEINYGRVQE